MKKIILAYDGDHFSEGAFEFARQLNEIEPILLTGIFLPLVQYANMYGYADSGSGPLFLSVIEGDNREAMVQNVKRFKSKCIDNGINFRIHEDTDDFALPGLKKETRYADLLILGSESFYENLGTNRPNSYLTEILHVAECPIVVVPEKFEFPDNNILAYDGSESSMYAIKQFSYLFPQFAQNKTTIVSTVEQGDRIQHEYQMREYATTMFPQLSVNKLHIDAKKYFATWISEKPKCIVVAGSFGRSFISQLFRSSFIADVIADHKLPVFIAHR